MLPCIWQVVDYPHGRRIHSLTEHVDPIEEAAADECLTSRAALGLDIHEAKGLSQWLSVTTPRELWLSFARHARESVCTAPRYT